MATSHMPREILASYTPDNSQFVQQLAAYHERRGTTLDPEPRVSNRNVDLQLLYKIVIERGGYDRVSEEKLAWRLVAQDLHVGGANLPAAAFAVKTIYYKFLAAYEISKFHGKEPPPKEILEEVSAKGHGILARTMDNYRPAEKKTGLSTDQSEASGDDGTPARDGREESQEIPGSASGGRATRGLRQAPPQRILFQPEAQTSRVTRNISNTSHSNTPQHHQNHQQHQLARGASTSNNPSTMEYTSAAVANYEPRPQMPLTLRPVVTPGNNAVEFARRQKILRDNAIAQNGNNTVINRGIMLPGSGFDGPNIYVRCLCALRSGIPAEQDYALHHLVKISMERGDKYRFEGFPGLAEALIEKVLEVSSLFYEIDWEIVYAEDGDWVSANVINGVDGTPDILHRLANMSKRQVDDNVQTEDFSNKMLQINEAALTLRNMVMLEENAQYVSELSPLRDFISIALNLPKVDSVVELKHYALDIAEQLTKYLHFDHTDPLYVSLLEQLHSNDRGAILIALRAISRISMNLEENNLLRGVPASVLQNIVDWTLLNDEDLVHACLDFLYQYTAVVDNVDFMISELQVEPLINQLIRLLTHNAKTVTKEYQFKPDSRTHPPVAIAPLPQELLSQLLKLEEPERSSQWLRCLFEEDPEESITQITLWQSYQACFTPMAASTGIHLLPAADFIKNVSTTFAEKAAAQVQTGAVQKFIIKGIRFRSAPVDFNGVEYRKCLWKATYGTGGKCGSFFMAPESMYQHILKTHFGASQMEDGRFSNTARQYSCLWDGCSRFKENPAPKLSQIAGHIKVHLPPRPPASSESDYASPSPAKKQKPSYIKPSAKFNVTYRITPVDDRNDAAGIPLSAVLVLRNLARNISKTDAEEVAMKQDGQVSWVERLFKPVEPKLFDVMQQNKSLTMYMTDLLGAVKDA